MALTRPSRVATVRSRWQRSGKTVRRHIWISAGLALLSACATSSSIHSTDVNAEAARIVPTMQAPTIDYIDGRTLPLTPPTRADYAQLRLVERAGYRTPLHVHHDTDETFLVVQGELTLFVEGELHTLGAGDFAFIPRGTPHAQGNSGHAEATMLVTLSPGAFAGFFEARAALVRETPPDHPQYGARMRALGERFDIEVLAPPPF